MNFLGEGFQTLEHYRQTDRQTYRQTDMTENITTLHSRVMKVNEKRWTECCYVIRGINKIRFVRQGHYRPVCRGLQFRSSIALLFACHWRQPSDLLYSHKSTAY